MRADSTAKGIERLTTAFLSLLIIGLVKGDFFMTEIAKAYEPHSVEKKRYPYW